MSHNTASRWSDLQLSDPIYRAINELQWNSPTSVQLETIPLALAGRDLLSSAVTGSGKTGAFGIPIIERLFLRKSLKGMAAGTSALILSPNRELAMQIATVLTDLARYTNVTVTLITGGLSQQRQEAELFKTPDIIVATPGRLLDHLKNTAGFELSDLAILVLDEADKLLDYGFTDAIAEITKYLPESRQTMLFSATINSDITSLANHTLKQPVRVAVDPNRGVASGLVQEFIKIKVNGDNDDDENENENESNEGKNESENENENNEEEEKKPKRQETVEQKTFLKKQAVVLALLERTFESRVIIFCRTKSTTSYLGNLLLARGIKVSVLHGDMTQPQRSDSLEQFASGQTDVLVATDVASRGIDVQDVSCVIQFDCALTVDTYVHRVGRAARAGREGVSICLVSEAERPLMKTIVKACATAVANDNENVLSKKVTRAAVFKQRKIPSDVIKSYMNEIRTQNLGEKAREMSNREKFEREVQQTEKQIEKAKNLIEHKDEIYSRPKREWFQSKKEKEVIRELSRQIENRELSKEEANALKTNKSITKNNIKVQKAELNKKAVSKDAELPVETLAVIRKKKQEGKEFAKSGVPVGLKKAIERKEQKKLEKAKKRKSLIAKNGGKAPSKLKILSKDEIVRIAAKQVLKEKKITFKRQGKNFKSLGRYKRK